ncbi:hypothetical protein D0Z00_004642 [Geotrichum galactomycetum]|uniref:Uncharacterized protein n=1 Tax=Geotrichum galactomycetum TaxID=27317 RepID=A0ACB6UXV2_9ASCO|nr:hypothetical protein D0Z00_004642 [Geotrichum candidum]
MTSPIHYSSSPEEQPQLATTPPSKRRVAGSPTRLAPPGPESVRLSYGMGPSIDDAGGDSPTMHTKAYKRRRESELFEERQRRLQTEQREVMEERRVQSSPSKRLQRQQQQRAAKRVRSYDEPSGVAAAAATTGENTETRLAELEGKFLEQAQRIQVLERQLLQMARIVNKLTHALESKKDSPDQPQRQQSHLPPRPADNTKENSAGGSSSSHASSGAGDHAGGRGTNEPEVMIYNEEEEQETDIENNEPPKPTRRPLESLDVGTLYPHEDKEGE